MAALYCSVPPVKLSVPAVPMAPALPTLSTPAPNVVPPVYVFVPISVSVSAPTLLMLPAPALLSWMTFASVTLVPAATPGSIAREPVIAMAPVMVPVMLFALSVKTFVPPV